MRVWTCLPGRNTVRRRDAINDARVLFIEHQQLILSTQNPKLDQIAKHVGHERVWHSAVMKSERSKALRSNEIPEEVR